MLELNPEKKLAGVLAPVFAIRGENDLGIGDTAALKELITWAKSRQMRVVQILPINETGSDNSPYNLLSAMALEPSTITTTPAALPDLTAEDATRILGEHDLETLKVGPVKYAEVKKLKRELLEAAFKTFETDKARMRVFAKFEKAQKSWLENYALHRALVSWHDESEVSTDWPKEHRSPKAALEWVKALKPKDKRRMRDLMKFHAYVQWIAWTQWQEVREHAEKEDVALMGDVPVGVSIYSTDVWATPKNFDLKRSSGAPPEKVFKSDPFTEKWGQNWGFPLYDWERMAKDDYAWWRLRLRLLMSVFHLLRVDHALGFFRIYSFPWRPEDNEKFTNLTPEQAEELTGGELPRFMDHDDETEENRAYNKAHGVKIYKMLVEEIGEHRLIAEDLGEVAPYVRPTLQDMQIPGFKIPQWERTGDRLTPGFEYQRLSLATYATHDHPPLKVHWDELYAAALGEDKEAAEAAIHSMWELVDFCGKPETKLPQPFDGEIHQLLLFGLFVTNSWLAVNMITDIFGTAERFNVPGSAGSMNWTQRMPQLVADWNQGYPEALKAVETALGQTNRA